MIFNILNSTLPIRIISALHRKIFLSVIFIFTVFIVNAQLVPLNYQVQNRVNELVQASDSFILTGYHSMDWLELQHQHALQPGSSMQDSALGLSAAASGAFDNLFNKHWISASNRKNILVIDPVIDAMGGKSSDRNGALADVAGGVRIQAVLHNKVSAGFTAYTGYRAYTDYVNNNIVNNTNVIPYENGSTPSGSGYRFTNYNAWLNYVPDKHILVGAGYGKQFVGDGYRSLFLSDNAGNYPYVRLKAGFWKVSYNVLFSLYDNNTFVDGSKQKKYSVIHYLNFGLGKKLQLGFFENIVWLARDTNYQRGFDVQYLNPLMILRPVEFSIGSPDNALLGFTWKYKMRRSYLYGQIGIDDINLGQTFKYKKQHLNNKYFLQLGLWRKDLFAVKGLDWRLEWNGVRPYTYGHRKVSQNYTHNHQSITDPFGANFHEFISFFTYTRQRWVASLENLVTIRGEDTTLGYNNGDNLWGGEGGVPPIGSTTMQGTKNYYLFHQLSVGYIVNPANRLSVMLNLGMRQHFAPGIKQQELSVGFGISTALWNKNYDF